MFHNMIDMSIIFSFFVNVCLHFYNSTKGGVREYRDLLIFLHFHFIAEETETPKSQISY